ncbi:MAG: quinone-dependent dihydroorotate dehydrogenase [Bdellovibrionota bacterium]
MSLYKSLIRPVFFQLDPEKSHKLALKLSSLLRLPFLRTLVSSHLTVKNPALKVQLFGLDFPNPVGVAAGVDKDCEVLDVFKTFGFGWVEAGTVTPEPQIGNPKPRMHRFPKDLALVNSMGFPSIGVKNVKAYLARFNGKKTLLPLIGMNVVKNKTQEGDEAYQGYAKVVEGLYEFSDFFIVNVSSPNMPGLREFQESNKLKLIFDAIKNVNPENKPVLVKFAPDLTLDQLNDALKTCNEAKISGVVATNTTISREVLPEASDLPGGVSGKPLRARSLEVVKHIYTYTNGKLPIIGVGGITTADDAIKMIRAGASLIAIYTGLVYEGPGFAQQINLKLSEHLKLNNLSSLSDLVGVDCLLSKEARKTA